MRDMADGKASYSPLFILVTCLFIAALIAANIISVKLIAVGNWFVPAGVVIFPLSYIFGDVLTEVYGYRAARRVIWLGFLCNLLVVLAIWVAVCGPPHPSGRTSKPTTLSLASRRGCSLRPSWPTWSGNSRIRLCWLASKLRPPVAGCGCAPSARH